MKRLVLLWVVGACALVSRAQLLTWSPAFPLESDPAQTLVITMDAAKGNQGLFNYTNATDVYIHIGVITTLSSSNTDWKHVQTTWAPATPAAFRATYLGNNKWQFTISGSLRTFFGVTDVNEKILKIAVLFRSGDGSKVQRNADGTDMFIPVYDNSLAVRITTPPMQPTFKPVPEPITKAVGETITITAQSNTAATLRFYLNGAVIQTATNATTISAYPVLSTPGNQVIIAEADNGTLIKRDTLQFFIAPAINVAPLPAGLRDGINYEPNNTAVTLVLRAPGKNRVSVIGEFPGSNWAEQQQFVMNKTPDGKFWWLRIAGLTPGVEYAYQYLVDGTLRIADPFTEKVLDPYADQYIAPATYPGLKAYPAGQSGIVSTLQTAQPAYNWSAQNFTRPDKRGLVVYELLLRDFVSAHEWKTIRDSLNYLKTLGINAVEIMPFNEFEGNESWGYNPDFYFAPDKYYGTKNSLKEFIDSAHRKGIAVIMDIALNHSFGLSPMVQLYWDAVNNRPAANNPWYNPVPKHAYNVGFDFNHESADTKYFTGRVLEHWLQEYKIDGFRFDLSKGFTQKQTCDNNGANCNEGAMSAYDASRITILKAYHDSAQSKSQNAYVILEHFADNTEEKELADYGMLLWGNMNYNYGQAAIGDVANSNLDGGLYISRGWTKPHLVTYMESHDEERITFKAENFGYSSGNYNIRDTATALKRMELDAAFLFTTPGPKMIWQFGELGYDYSINRCTDGTINNNCRLANKPIRWDYLKDVRRKSVYDTYSKLINLRFHPWYQNNFVAPATIERSLGGAIKWIKVSSAADSSDMLVIGNFGLAPDIGTVSFQTAGTWFDYFANTTFSTTGQVQNISLQPGEFKVYVNRNVNNIAVTPVRNVAWNGSGLEAKAFPNPVVTDLTLELKLPQSSNVTISMYNSLGQFVSTIYNGFAQQGTKQINLKRPEVSRGIYILKVKTRSDAISIPVTIQ